MSRQPKFGGLLAATAILGLANSFFSPFVSTWGTEEVKMSPAGFSIFMTCTSICAICAGTLLGRLSDTRFARRHILLLGAGGGMLAYLGYGYVRNPYLLGLIGCTCLAVSTGCFSQLFAHVREEYHKPQPGAGGAAMIMSVVRVCFSFSWTVGPALGSVLLVNFGFRGLFSSAAAIWGLFLLGVILFVPYRPRPERSLANSGPSVWQSFNQPGVPICFFAFLAVFAAFSINMLNLPLAILHVMGGTKGDFGIVFGIGPLVEIPLMLWFGHLSSRGYQLPLIRLGFVLAVLYFFGLCFATEPWHVYMLQIVSGAFISIIANIAIVFFQDLLPGQAGLATALYANAQAAGNLVGVLSFGFIVQEIGNRGAFIVCCAVSVLALLLILFYRRGPALEPEPVPLA